MLNFADKLIFICNKNSGQSIIGFMIFMVIIIPVFIGTTQYMEKYLHKIDVINKLDIVSISVTRVKSGILNQIAENNRLIINISRIKCILEAIDKLSIKSFPVINAIVLLMDKIINIVSKVNYYLVKYAPDLLKAALIRVSFQNNIKILTSQKFFDINLCKISKIEMAKKTFCEVTKNIGVYIGDENFNKNNLATFRLGGNNIFYDFFSETILRGENMFESKFGSILVRGDN